MSSNGNENTNDLGNAIKQFIPVLILFIIGFIIGFIFIGDNMVDGGLVGRIFVSIFLGWAIGGTVLGWIKTRKWFSPDVQQKTYQSQSGIFDHNAFFKAAKLPIRIICAEVVGFVLMPVELIKFIIAIVRLKKVSNTINTNNGENE